MIVVTGALAETGRKRATAETGRSHPGSGRFPAGQHPRRRLGSRRTRRQIQLLFPQPNSSSRYIHFCNYFQSNAMPLTDPICRFRGVQTGNGANRETGRKLSAV